MLQQMQGAGWLRGVFVRDRLEGVHAEKSPVGARLEGGRLCVLEVQPMINKLQGSRVYGVRLGQIGSELGPRI